MVAKRNKAWWHAGPVTHLNDVNFNRAVSFGAGAELKYINSMSDFPEPVGGVINLQPNTKYLITGVGLTTPNRFECAGNCAIEGLWTFGPLQLTYTGTGSMFTVTQGSFDIRNTFLDCPNATWLTMSDPPPGLGAGVWAFGLLVLSCAKLANLTEVTVDMSRVAAFIVGDGITVNATTSDPLFSLRQFSFNSLLNGATAIDLNTSIFNTFELRDVVFGPPASGTATAISGLANSGNFPVGRFGLVQSCEFSSAVGLANLSGISADDVRWFFRDNANQQDTFVRGLNSLVNNTTNTVIAAVNTPVPIAGTWSLLDTSQYQQGGAGTSQLQYLGERSLRQAIDISVTLRAISGSPPFRVQVYKNGSPIAGASVVLEPSTAVDLAGSIHWLELLTQNDIIEVYVENLIDATDVLVTDGSMRLLGDI